MDAIWRVLKICVLTKEVATHAPRQRYPMAGHRVNGPGRMFGVLDGSTAKQGPCFQEFFRLSVKKKESDPDAKSEKHIRNAARYSCHPRPALLFRL